MMTYRDKFLFTHSAFAAFCLAQFGLAASLLPVAMPSEALPSGTIRVPDDSRKVDDRQSYILPTIALALSAVGLCLNAYLVFLVQTMRETFWVFAWESPKNVEVPEEIQRAVEGISAFFQMAWTWSVFLPLAAFVTCALSLSWIVGLVVAITVACLIGLHRVARMAGGLAEPLARLHKLDQREGENRDLPDQSTSQGPIDR